MGDTGSSYQQLLALEDGIESDKEYKVKNIHTNERNYVFKKKRLLTLTEQEKSSALITVKAHNGGVVKDIHCKTGDILKLGSPVISIGQCEHPTVLGNLCCDCGVTLEEQSMTSQDGMHAPAHVSMVHTMPDLKVSQQEAKRLGTQDMNNLLSKKKLALLVDLDQTLIHTTDDDVPPTLKDVFHFQLHDKRRWFHTRLRPYAKIFLDNMSKLYEMHICTFGIREYAHHIAKFLDPDKKLFGHRILSRNECIDPMSKKANLSSLFPCGDNMVCIIDDRSDVWNFAPNVVQVLPYHFFQHTGDINAPPGLEKMEEDDRAGFNFADIKNNSLVSTKDKNIAQESTNIPESQVAETKDDESSVNIEPQVKESSIIENLDQKIVNPVINCESKSVTSENTEEITEEKSAEGTGKENTKTSEDLQNTEKISSENDMPNTKVCNETNDTSSKQENTSINPCEESSKNIKDSKSSESLETNSVEAQEIDVLDNDDYLLYLEDILTLLHSRFYEQYTDSSLPDLKVIVPERRNAVLQGVNIVFSGIIPNDMALTDSKAYHIAKSLGANVSDTIQDSSKPHPTTHVVAANLFTGKVKQAIKMKLYVVNPDWLWCCSERWNKAEENLFRLSKDTKEIRRNPPMHCLVPVSSKPVDIELPKRVERTPSMIDELNPLYFLSNDETKSMEMEVDVLLSDENDSEDEKTKKGNESESEDSSNIESSSDDSMEPKAKRRKLCTDDEDDRDEQDTDNDDELPSVRFRQGEPLPSDNSDEGSDDDMDAFGDLLEKMI